MQELIEWQALLFGTETAEFLVEVFLRSFMMFCLILIGLSASGKRGIKQLSIFELVIIIGLGSAAGDPMFYKDVGIVPAIMVFVVVVSLYRLVTWLSGKSKRFERLVEGSPIYLVREGRFAISDFKKEDLSQDEFFAELRVANVEHLGQVKTAVMETSGIISLLFYPEDEVKYGLPLYPDLYKKKSRGIGVEGLYACAYCGNTQQLKGASCCERCEREEWVPAMNTKRIS